MPLNQALSLQPFPSLRCPHQPQFTDFSKNCKLYNIYQCNVHKLLHLFTKRQSEYRQAVASPPHLIAAHTSHPASQLLLHASNTRLRVNAAEPILPLASQMLLLYSVYKIKFHRQLGLINILVQSTMYTPHQLQHSHLYACQTAARGCIYISECYRSGQWLYRLFLK